MVARMDSDRRSPSFYNVLGVCTNSSDEEIRRAYRMLAKKWHPDKWTRAPSQLGEAKRKFQQIQEAYSVLSDQRKRTMYDAGLYDPDEEEDEGFNDFLQEMMSLMADVRREDKTYSMEELQSMFMEMAQGFEFPQWSSYESPQWVSGSSMHDDSRNRKRARCEMNTTAERISCLQMPSFGLYHTSPFCNLSEWPK